MKLLKRLTPVAIFLTGFLTAHLMGCGNGPKVMVEVSDPDNQGMETYDEKTGKKGFVPYSQTKNHICFPPADFNTLLDYCGVKQ